MAEERATTVKWWQLTFSREGKKPFSIKPGRYLELPDL